MWHLIEFLASPEFMPHGHCYLWRPGLLWLNVASDISIFLAYASIPTTILYLYRRRPDLIPANVAYLFIIFISACGLTHLLAAWNVWHSAYWLAGGIKAVTATASIITAAAIWWLMPGFLSIPTLDVLQREIENKNSAVSALQEEQINLEKRVRERTASLEAKNEELLREKQRLETIQAVTVDRELAMVALKKEINGLLRELERPEKYVVDTPSEPS